MSKTILLLGVEGGQLVICEAAFRQTEQYERGIFMCSEPVRDGHVEAPRDSLNYGFIYIRFM